MGKNSIENFLKTSGFQMEVEELKVYQIVHVEFINAYELEDETSFDIRQIGTKAGNQQLVELYKDFCKDNNMKDNNVLQITVVASADTKEDLGQINM